MRDPHRLCVSDTAERSVIGCIDLEKYPVVVP